MSQAQTIHPSRRPPQRPRSRSGCRSPPTARSRNRRADRARQGHALLHGSTAGAVIDAAAGMWCTNAGHNRDPIVEAIQQQAAELDYRAGVPVRPSQGVRAGEPDRRAGAGRSRPRVLRQFGLGGGRHRAQDRARLSQHPRRGAAHPPDRPRARLSRRRLRRHRGRRHRQQPQGCSARCWPGVDHLPHTYNREQQAFSKGEPEWGAHLADELERIVALHDRLDHRGRDRRADGRLDRRAAVAQGLPAAAARDLRQVRHPARSSTRSSPASAGSATRSRPSATASCPT